MHAFLLGMSCSPSYNLYVHLEQMQLNASFACRFPAEPLQSLVMFFGPILHCQTGRGSIVPTECFWSLTPLLKTLSSSQWVQVNDFECMAFVTISSVTPGSTLNLALCDPGFIVQPSGNLHRTCTYRQQIDGWNKKSVYSILN